MAASTSPFTRNAHPIDRAARLILGLFLLSLVFWGPETLLGLSGLILLATAAAGFCPIYRLLGISTCPRGECQA